MSRYRVKKCKNPKCPNGDFVAHYNQLYCCEECKKEANKGPTYSKTCPYCERNFETTKRNQKFCCEQHRRAYHKAKYHATKEVIGHYCKECGEYFEDVPRARFCCDAHAKKYKKEADRARHERK